MNNGGKFLKNSHVEGAFPEFPQLENICLPHSCGVWWSWNERYYERVISRETMLSLSALPSLTPTQGNNWGEESKFSCPPQKNTYVSPKEGLTHEPLRNFSFSLLEKIIFLKFLSPLTPMVSLPAPCMYPAGSSSSITYRSSGQIGGKASTHDASWSLLIPEPKDASNGSEGHLPGLRQHCTSCSSSGTMIGCV